MTNQIPPQKRAGYRTPDCNLEPPEEGEYEKCDECEGKGWTWQKVDMIPGQTVTDTCPKCNGTGRVEKEATNTEG